MRWICLLLTPLIVGCASHHHLRTADGTYEISWQTNDDAPLAVNTYCDLLIHIDPPTSDGNPVDFRFDATMPAHRHGMNVMVHSIELEPGVWKVEDVLLHMPGEWALDFDITDSQGVLHRGRQMIDLK